MLFHIVSYEFTAARSAQSLKQRVELYSTGLFWSVFLICVFDLSILFDALSSSFPPHFNKDKTESRIVAAKSLSHKNMKSFMSGEEWKIKLFYFCSLWIRSNIVGLDAFSLLLLAMCLCVYGVGVCHTCIYILLSLLLLSESSAFVCFSCKVAWVCICVRKKVSGVHLWLSGVCFFLPSTIRHVCMGGCYSWIWPLCEKGTKMPH